MAQELLAHRYRVVRPLGEGAMGAVWLVDDNATGRQVALKAIKVGGGQSTRGLSSRGGSGAGVSEKSILQFKQEFRLMAQLRHPNCLEVYDYGELDDGTPYFTMEFVPGQDLAEVLPLAPARFQDVTTQLLLALGYLHQRGFVHRDLKPANARVRPDGRVKLMDYGLMEYAGRSGLPVVGTLGYLAPEIIHHGPIDGRADLYSLGCLGFELLTGSLPFEGPPMHVLRAHVSERPPSASQRAAGVDPEHDKLVTWLMQKEPLDRPQTAADVLKRLGVEPPPGIGGNVLAAPLVGRDGLIGRLEAAVRALEDAGQGGCWLLHGPAGVGKSRLVAEARCQAQLAGVACGAGHAVERQAEPYGPWIEVLRELLPAIRDEIPAVLDRHGPVLRALLPELPHEPAPLLHSPAKEKQRLQDALVEVLAALATERPTLVILEEWQWVDPLSIETLAYVRRAAAAIPIFVLLAGRRAEEPGPEWVRDLVQVPVMPLAREEVTRMIAAMLPGDDLVDGVADAIAARVGGNPFDVERAIERLAGEGDLAQLDGRWCLREGALADAALTDVDALLARRVADLPEAAVTVARIVALAGHACDLELIQAVASFEDAELLDAVDRLRAAAILVGDSGRRLTFVHDRYRERLYDDVPSDERVLLHELLLRALEERLGPVPEAELEGLPAETLGPIAAHALASGDRPAIARWALPAARRQFKLNSLAEADRLAAAGLSATPEPGERRRRYLELRGDVARITARLDVARPAYAEALSLSAGLDFPELPRLLASKALADLLAADYPAAREAAARAAEVASGRGQHGDLARALIAGCRTAIFLGDEPGAMKLAEQAVEAARTADQPSWLCESLGFLGHLMVSRGGPDAHAGIAMMREAADKLAGLGERVGLVNVLSMLGDALLQVGEPAAAREAFERVRDHAAAIGQIEEHEFALCNLGFAALDAGDLATALADGTAASASSLERRADFPAACGLIVEAVARAPRGELSSAREVAGRAIALARGTGNAYLMRHITPYAVEVALEAGALADAQAILATAVADDAPALTASRARVALARDDAAHALALATSAANAANVAGRGIEEARALLVVAQASLTLARADDARKAATAGLALAEARGARLVALDLLGVLGEVELRHGGDPASRFATMARLAVEAGARSRLAMARWGEAAAAPEAPRAAGLAAEAEALVAAIAAEADVETREAFLARPAIARLRGDGWRTARKAAPPSTPAPRFPLGFGP